MKNYSENFPKQREALMKMARDKPVISLSSKDLPPLEKWKIGSKYKIYATVELTSLRRSDTGMDGSLEIVSVSDEDNEDDTEGDMEDED